MKKSHDVNRRVRVFAAAVLLMVLCIFAVPAVAEDEVPSLPMQMFGTAVDKAGNGMPAGTEITAVSDDIVSTYVIKETGLIGKEGTFGEKFLIYGTTDGDAVTFSAAGTSSAQTVLFASGDLKELNLIFDTGVVPEKYTVTFNKNGGDTEANPSSIDETYGSKYVLPTTNPTKSGYTFAGWFTAANGGVQVTAETVVNTAAKHTLYAKWTENAPTVKSEPKIDVKPTQKEGGYIEIPTTPTGNTNVEVAQDKKSVTLTATTSQVEIKIVFTEAVTDEGDTVTGKVSEVKATYPKMNAPQQDAVHSIPLKLELSLKNDAIVGEIVIPVIDTQYNSGDANKAAQYSGTSPLATVTGSAPSGKSLNDINSKIKEVILVFENVKSLFTNNQVPAIYHVAGNGVVTPINEWRWNNNDLIFESDKGFSTYVLTAKTVKSTPSSEHDTDSSGRQQSATDYTAEQTVIVQQTPAESTAQPTPAAVPPQSVPVVSPVKPTPQASTPAPFLGILAGLGAAGLLFTLRRK